MGEEMRTIPFTSARHFHPKNGNATSKLEWFRIGGGGGGRSGELELVEREREREREGGKRLSLAESWHSPSLGEGRGNTEDKGERKLDDRNGKAPSANICIFAGGGGGGGSSGGLPRIPFSRCRSRVKEQCILFVPCSSYVRTKLWWRWCFLRSAVKIDGLARTGALKGVSHCCVGYFTKMLAVFGSQNLLALFQSLCEDIGWWVYAPTNPERLPYSLYYVLRTYLLLPHFWQESSTPRKPSWAALEIFLKPNCFRLNGFQRHNLRRIKEGPPELQGTLQTVLSERRRRKKKGRERERERFSHANRQNQILSSISPVQYDKRREGNVSRSLSLSNPLFQSLEEKGEAKEGIFSLPCILGMSPPLSSLSLPILPPLSRGARGEAIGCNGKQN